MREQRAKEEKTKENNSKQLERQRLARQQAGQSQQQQGKMMDLGTLSLTHKIITMELMEGMPSNPQLKTPTMPRLKIKKKDFFVLDGKNTHWSSE